MACRDRNIWCEKENKEIKIVAIDGTPKRSHTRKEIQWRLGRVPYFGKFFNKSFENNS
jgi:hypothetical protein